MNMVADTTDSFSSMEMIPHPVRSLHFIVWPVGIGFRFDDFIPVRSAAIVISLRARLSLCHRCHRHQTNQHNKYLFHGFYLWELYGEIIAEDG